MRIVSFLPSATEMLFALGLGDQVVGVTFECDFPPAACEKPQLVHSHLPPNLTPSEIDAIVRTEGAQGRSLYFVDMPRLEALAPDLILLQDLCRVCALDSPTLARDVSLLSSKPQLLSLSAHDLSGVLADIERVAAMAERSPQGHELTAKLRARIAAVAQRPTPRPQPRVLALEWLDPFFQGGHWIPEMIALAGGLPLLAEPGEKSVRLTWEQVREADPDVLLIMPCGYHLEETIAQYAAVALPPEWHELAAVRAGQVYAVDGSAYFSRPGPRLVDGLEMLAKLFRSEPGDYVRLGAAVASRAT